MAVASVLQWLGYGCPTQPDHFIYTQVARRWLAGGKLYQDVILDKPPGLVVWYAITHLLAPRSLCGIFAAVVIVLAAQCIAIIQLIRPNRLPGIVSIATLMLVQSAVSDWRWLSTEHLSNIFLTLLVASCVAAQIRGAMTVERAVFWGILVGCAFLTRQPVLTFVLVPVVTVVCFHHAWRQKMILIAAVISGAAAAALVSVVFVGLQGSLVGYMYVLFVFPRMYADQGVFTGWWFLRCAAESGVLFIMIPTIIIALFSPVRAPLLAALVAGVVAVVSPRREFAHYFVSLFPFMAVTLAIGTPPRWWPAKFRRRGQMSMNTAGMLILACSVLLVVASSLARDYPSAREERQARSAWTELVRVIDRAVDKTDGTLWVVGPMGLERAAFLSRLRQSYPIATSWELEMEAFLGLWGSRDRVLSEYVASPPDVLLVANKFIAQSEEECVTKDLATSVVEKLRSRFVYVEAWSSEELTVLVRLDLDTAGTRGAESDWSRSIGGT